MLPTRDDCGISGLLIPSLAHAIRNTLFATAESHERTGINVHTLCYQRSCGNDYIRQILFERWMGSCASVFASKRLVLAPVVTSGALKFGLACLYWCTLAVRRRLRVPSHTAYVEMSYAVLFPDVLGFILAGASREGEHRCSVHPAGSERPFHKQPASSYVVSVVQPIRRIISPPCCLGITRIQRHMTAP